MLLMLVLGAGFYKTQATDAHDARFGARLRRTQTADAHDARFGGPGSTKHRQLMLMMLALGRGSEGHKPLMLMMLVLVGRVLKDTGN